MNITVIFFCKSKVCIHRFCVFSYYTDANVKRNKRFFSLTHKWQLPQSPCCLLNKFFYDVFQFIFAHLAGAVEYTDCFSAEE